jgi:hypothetical protein
MYYVCSKLFFNHPLDEGLDNNLKFSGKNLGLCLFIPNSVSQNSEFSVKTLSDKFCTNDSNIALNDSNSTINVVYNSRQSIADPQSRLEDVLYRIIFDMKNKMDKEKGSDNYLSKKRYFNWVDRLFQDKNDITAKLIEEQDTQIKKKAKLIEEQDTKIKKLENEKMQFKKEK